MRDLLALSQSDMKLKLLCLFRISASFLLWVCVCVVVVVFVVLKLIVSSIVTGTFKIIFLPKLALKFVSSLISISPWQAWKTYRFSISYTWHHIMLSGDIIQCLVKGILLFTFFTFQKWIVTITWTTHFLYFNIWFYMFLLHLHVSAIPASKTWNDC